MTTQNNAFDRARIGLALETSIHVGLAILLTASCLFILRPFLPLLAWGTVIAVSAYPGFLRVQGKFGGRGALTATLFTLVLLGLLIAPVILLTGTLVDGVQTLTARLKDGTLLIPPPPPSVEHWPLIGLPVNRLWLSASRDLGHLLTQFAPQIKAFVPGLFTASAEIGFTVLQFGLSILVAGALLANAEPAYRMTFSLMKRLFGKNGPEYQELIGSTIRSVTTGILGVAFIQSILAGLGFLVVGIPGAGLWAVVFLIAAVLQVGVVVLIPAVVYVFAVSTTASAIAFLIWCVIVALIDNVLKPVLLGRGAAVPIIVVFLGAIGGFVVLGIIGLFVGAIVLSVAYKLFLAWMDAEPGANPEA